MSAVLEKVPARGNEVRYGAIRIDDVVKIYDPEGAAVMAVDHCSVDIKAGEICMIVGPSGCGKTSLLNAIAGFHDITSGAIYMDGEMLCGPGKPKADPGADRIVVFQNGALFPWKTNLENVAFGPMMQGKLSKKEIMEKARSMMADAGLSGTEHNYPGEVSSGLRRRVEIVRALMNDPKVLLFDEPYRRGLRRRELFESSFPPCPDIRTGPSETPRIGRIGLPSRVRRVARTTRGAVGLRTGLEHLKARYEPSCRIRGRRS